MHGPTHAERLLANGGGSTGHAVSPPIVHPGSLFDRQEIAQKRSDFPFLVTNHIAAVVSGEGLRPMRVQLN